MPFCSHPKVFNHRLVPCGHCINCRRRRINDWSVRMDLENRMHDGKGLFCTLTYNDDNLPENTLLNKKDLQAFLKRLRSYLDYYGLGKIKYFASGEYGEHGTIRPHYHIVIFGLQFKKGIKDLISKCWKKGFVDVKKLSFQNCKYVAKYCNKTMQKDKVNDITGEVVSEFVTMSRRGGGIGYDFFKKIDLDKYFKKNNNLIKVGKFAYSVPLSVRKFLKDKLGFSFEKKVRVFCDFTKFSMSKLSLVLDKYCFDNKINDKNIVISDFSNFRQFLSQCYQSEMNYFKSNKDKYYKYYEDNKNKFDFFNYNDLFEYIRHYNYYLII